MESMIKVGIAGFGIVGQKRKFHIDQNPNMEVTAICDVRFKNDLSMIDNESIDYRYNDLEKETINIKNKDIRNITYFRDFRDMIKKSKIEALFVCLPNYLASEATILGLENKCNVFCEKPPGRTVEEVRLVKKTFLKYPKLKLKYGFNHRYHESVKKAYEYINSNIFGRVVSFRGVYGKSNIIPFGNGWRSEKKYAGGGILLDQGIHMLDLIRHFSGDYEEIYSFVDNSYWKHDIEDNAFILMRNKKGQVASLHSTATQWQHRFRLEIILEEALIELSGILSGSKSYGSETLKITERTHGDGSGSQEHKEFTFLQDNSWKEEVDEFSSCIFNDKLVLNGTVDEALKTMEMISKIYKADKTWLSNLK